MLIFVGVELSLCIVFTLSQNAITCFWNKVEYKIVLFHYNGIAESCFGNIFIAAMCTDNVTLYINSEPVSLVNEFIKILALIKVLKDLKKSE